MGWHRRTGLLLALAPSLIGPQPARSSETTYTCINNSDGTSTCVTGPAGRELTCTTSGSGVRTCLDSSSGQQLNCVVSSGGTVSCLDPETNEKLDCQAVGMGENACRPGNGKPRSSEIITEPSIFQAPQGNEIESFPGFPKVIELPSAF
jgi:hypothetical protein